MKSKFILISLVALSFASAKNISLEQAYNMALQNNNDLRASSYQNLAAKERVERSFANFLPNLSAEASYNADKYNRLKQKIDEGYTKYGLKLNQTIFEPAIYYSYKQDKIREQSSNLEFENAKQELAKKLTETYFQYTFAKDYLNLTQSYTKANKARYDKMAKSLNLGLTNKMDALEAKVRYDESLMSTSRALREIKIAKLELSKLVGEDVDIKDSFANLDIEFFKNINLSIFEDTNKNIAYKQANLSHQLAINETKKRFSGHLPTINLTLGIYNQNYKSDDFLDKKNKFEASIRFNLPLFYGGSVKSSVEEGQYLELASLEYQNSKFKEINIAQKKHISDFLSYIEEYQISQNAVHHAELYEESIQKGHNEGLKSLVDLLDAQSRTFKVRNERLYAGYKLVMQYLELQGLIGNISQKTMSDLQRAF